MKGLTPEMIWIKRYKSAVESIRDMYNPKSSLRKKYLHYLWEK